MKFIFSLITLISFNALAEDVLWRSDKHALALCKKLKESVCLVIVNNHVTDVSLIEGKNIGALGLAKKEQFDNVITTPFRWRRTSEEGDLIQFKTTMWLKGQRYTTKGYVFVDKNGTFIHQ